MTGRVIVSGSFAHRCSPGWTYADGYYHPEDWLPPGTVWECECGSVWVAVAMKKHEHPGLVAGRTWWRPRRERRRRFKALEASHGTPHPD